MADHASHVVTTCLLRIAQCTMRHRMVYQKPPLAECPIHGAQGDHKDSLPPDQPNHMGPPARHNHLDCHNHPAAHDHLDHQWMCQALELAQIAANRGDVPVGAVITHNGRVVGRGFNQKEALLRPTGHAEIIAIEDASQALGRWRLSGCTLYVTLEPCVMCAGAIIHARVDRVVFAAPDPKAGAVRSLYQLLSDPRLNHAPLVTEGVLQNECSSQLKEFFRKLRQAR